MKKSLVSLFLLTYCFTFTFAQTESGKLDKLKNILYTLKSRPKAEKVSEERLKAVCKEDFVGENVNLNVVNADVKDILNYITDEYGFDFVVDENLKLKPVTRKVENKPWNVVLLQILNEQELTMDCNERVLRIAEHKALLNSCLFPINKGNINSPLNMEFVVLKNINIKTIGQERYGDTVNPIFDEKGNEFIDLIKKRLSKRGSVEVGQMEKKTVLVLTDERNNLDALVELVKLLDVPEKSVN